MKVNFQRAASVMAGVTLLCVAAVTPAHAEGSFNTYISNWYVSNESRHWKDSNADGAWTGVYFEGCSTNGAFNQAGLMLRKAVDWQPDPSKGSRTNYCGWVDWKDPDDVGVHYFRLDSLLNGGYLWVDYVKIGW